MKTKINIQNPYKISLKDLSLVLFVSLLVVVMVSFGLSYLEKSLEPRLALAEPLEYHGQIFSYTDGYLGEFGKSYLATDPLPEILFSLK